MTAVWTFASAQSPGVIPPSGPVTVVRFTPTLPTGSTAKVGTTLTVPFSLQGAAPKADSLRKLAFAVSYDNGRTWHRTTAVQGKQQLKLRSPATPSPVSLRATLTDAKANTLTQTIHSAYRPPSRGRHPATGTRAGEAMRLPHAGSPCLARPVDRLIGGAKSLVQRAGTRTPPLCGDHPHTHLLVRERTPRRCR
ncbi:hypothetical protein M2163_000663 [Streptomyces sp. SAI-135]|nr:hypothetical protein [Streptomyces sp. SAI-090]MDH6613555.1 hypothetical protein [Streptomyces sp. SAI-135]